MRKRIEPVAKYTISCAGDILWFTFFFPLPPQILFISTVSRGWANACPHRPPTVWRGVKNVGRTLGFPGSLIANAKVLVVSSSCILAIKRKKKCANCLAGRAACVFDLLPRGISKIISSLSRLINHQAVRTAVYSFTIARTSHGFFTAR